MPPSNSWTAAPSAPAFTPFTFELLRMYNDDDLSSAITAGILSENTATAFRIHAAGRGSALANAPDEENIRLITSFNDIFIVIACALLLVSVGWIVSSLATAWAGFLAVAIVSWSLAEFFTRRRHMALPSIILLLTFAVSVYSAGALLLQNFSISANNAMSISAIMTAAVSLLHWKRFRVPIGVAVSFAAVSVGAVVYWVDSLTAAWSGGVVLVWLLGAGIFMLAMRWDSTDPLRRTYRSDVAFWLHMLAAPLLVHPVFLSLGLYGVSVSGSGSESASLLQTSAVVVLYFLIALVSLAIDRRALMVSALAYVLYAFNALLKNYGVVDLGFAIAALGIGFTLLLLSAFWRQTRAQIVKRFPARLQAALPSIR